MFLKDQVLEVPQCRVRLHIARRERFHDEWNSQSEGDYTVLSDASRVTHHATQGSWGPLAVTCDGLSKSDRASGACTPRAARAANSEPRRHIGEPLR
jgi:hypothetical protein